MTAFNFRKIILPTVPTEVRRQKQEPESQGRRNSLVQVNNNEVWNHSNGSYGFRRSHDQMSKRKE